MNNKETFIDWLAQFNHALHSCVNRECDYQSLHWFKTLYDRGHSADFAALLVASDDEYARYRQV